MIDDLSAIKRIQEKYKIKTTEDIENCEKMVCLVKKWQFKKKN